MNIAALLSGPFALAVGQWVLGFFLKRYPQFPNRFIPIATYVLALFGFSVAPAVAHASGLVDALCPSGNIFLLSLLQNLLVTGTHGTWKNTVFPALKNVLGSLFGK